MKSPERVAAREGEGWGPVVAHNLNMMRTAMIELVLRESIGGNAGTATVDGREYRCAGANGYADPETGRIVAFGNVQDLDPSAIRGKTEFTFRIAFAPADGSRGTASGKVVECMKGNWEPLAHASLSPVVDGVLKASIEKYNASL